jgi:CO/xanthine dehydrogenase Mo-binding subunit
MHPDGTVTVLSGSHSHGQGHVTTFAQIAADELGVAPDAVHVIQGDTDTVPFWHRNVQLALGSGRGKRGKDRRGAS